MLCHIQRTGPIPGPAQKAIPSWPQLLQLFPDHQLIQGPVHNSPALFIINKKQLRYLLIVIYLPGASSKYPHDQCGSLFA